MKVSAEKIKEWSNQEISPIAWQRIIVKALPQLREEGLEFSDLMNPTNLVLSGKAFEVVASVVEELYQVELPVECVLV
jgi:hypothetical protein